MTLRRITDSIDSTDLFSRLGLFPEEESSSEVDPLCKDARIDGEKIQISNKITYHIKRLNKLAQTNKDEDNKKAFFFSQYELARQLRILLASLTDDERESIADLQKVYDDEFGWGDWANNASDKGMTYFYALLVSLTFSAVVLNAFGASAGQTYGFNNAAVELSFSYMWNVTSDSTGAAQQGYVQFLREEKAIATINFINVIASVICASVAVFEFTKDHLLLASELCGWSFALSMFVSASVEAIQWRKASENKNKLINQLQEKIQDNIPNVKEDTASLKDIIDSVELVKASTNILMKFPDKTSEEYKECKASLDIIAIENAQANNHFCSMLSCVGCGIAMMMSAIGTTFVASQSYGASLALQTVIFPHLSACFSVVTAAFRYTIGSCTDDVLNVTQAIRERDAILKPLEENNPEIIENKAIKIDEIKGKKSNIRNACLCVSSFFQPNKKSNAEVKSENIIISPLSSQESSVPC